MTTENQAPEGAPADSLAGRRRAYQALMDDYLVVWNERNELKEQLAAAQAPAEGYSPAELAEMAGVKALPIMLALKDAGREATLNQKVTVEDLAAALANVQPKGTEPESDGDLRRRVLDVAKAIGLINWVSDDRRFFTFAGDEAMSSKLVDLVRLTAAPSPAPAPEPELAERLLLLGLGVAYDGGTLNDGRFAFPSKDRFITAANAIFEAGAASATQAPAPAQANGTAVAWWLTGTSHVEVTEKRDYHGGPEWTPLFSSPAVGERIAGPLAPHPIADIICAWANGFRVEFRYRHHNPGNPEEIYLSDERWHLCGKAYSAWSSINEHRIHADDLADWEAFKKAQPPVQPMGDTNG